jgi:hypothetical protein
MQRIKLIKTAAIVRGEITTRFTAFKASSNAAAFIRKSLCSQFEDGCRHKDIHVRVIPNYATV